jgi:Tfp pilus assembly protein PilX
MNNLLLRLKRLQQSQSGSFLVMVLVMILLITALGISIAELTTVQYQHAKRAIYEQNAGLVAEAGIEQTVHQLNVNDSFGGYPSAQEFFDNSSQGLGTYTTTVTSNADDNSKIILAVGKVYRHSGDANPYITRKLRVTVVGTSSGGYSVSTGPGGLILGGSASITNSNVYVNGTITMNGSSKIGTASNPLNVDVANIACPKGTNPGSTYPTLCTDGSQPISMAFSTAIYGSVCATGQTSKGPNNNIKTGDTGAGLKIGCVAPTVAQPVYNRTAQIAAVTTTGSATDTTYDCGKYQNPIGFKRTWPANLKLTGTVEADSSCDLTITGNVYITGDLDIGGAAKIRVADSVGTTRPIVMVDGSITIDGSGGFIANSSGTGIDFVSFKNSTGNPAATPTGTDLYNSQKLLTVDVGGAVNSAGMMFDAYWSKVSIAGSGNVGAAAGQTVDLSGAGTVVFGTKLSSGSKTWTITSYQEVFD